MSAAAAASAPIAAILAQLNRVILGKEEQIRLCLACLLARGHLLIEDIPGVGKTTLAHALARTLGLSFQRVQFTSDLLPADVLGVSIFDRETGRLGQLRHRHHTNTDDYDVRGDLPPIDGVNATDA